MKRFLVIFPMLVSLVACGERDARQDFMDSCTQAKPETEKICPDLQAISWSEMGKTMPVLSIKDGHTLSIQLNRPFMQLGSGPNNPIDTRIFTFSIQDQVISFCIKQAAVADSCIPLDRVKTTWSRAFFEGNIIFTDEPGSDNIQIYVYPQELRSFDTNKKVQLEVQVKDWQDVVRTLTLDATISAS